MGEDLTKFCDAVCEKLHLTEDEKLKKQKAAVVSTFKLVAFAEESDGKVEELALTLDEFRSLYGFIFAAENDEGKVDVAYTFYQLEFKLKEVVDGFSPEENGHQDALQQERGPPDAAAGKCHQG